jgi:hypothetical protein
MSSAVQLADALQSAANDAVRKAARAMLDRQYEQGYWWADLTADSTLESDFILLQLWLHPPVDGVWNPPSRPLVERGVQAILDRQLPDGGFNIFHKGPSEISASIKAYFALKVAGVPAADPRMQSLRDRIIDMGGIQSANSYVKVNLSLFNLYPREGTPAIPPELMLAGNLIYEMSSWTRAIVIPLSIVHAMNPARPVPAGFDLQELLKPGVPVTFAFNKHEIFQLAQHLSHSRPRAQVVGTLRFENHPNPRHPPRGTMDPRTHQVLGRTGGDLPIDAVRDHGAGPARLLHRPSGSQRSAAPVRSLDDP